MDREPTRLILSMPEHTEPKSAEEVLQSSELAARLLRRLIASPGVIDTQRVFKTYARLTELITHTHPLLHDLLTRYIIDDDSALQNLPLVMDQPWMLNLNTYLTNNNSYSSTSTSTSTTNNSFLAGTTNNQSILQSTTSSSTHSELLGPTSQSSPPETFRISRNPAGRRQSVPVVAQDLVLNPVSKSAESVVSSMVHTERHRLTEHAKTASTDLTHSQMPLAQPVIQRELLETEIKSSRLVLKDTALPQKSGSALGQGQYRNAVESGESRTSNNSSDIDAQRRPDATALRYRPLPTVTLGAELKDTARIKDEKHFVTDRNIDVRQATNTTRTLFAKTDTVAATTPPTFPLVHEQLPSAQFQTRPQQLVWRKSADSLTLRDLVSDLSSNSPLAAVRQALDSLPVVQSSPNAQMIKPESVSREDAPPTSEEITTENMLRRISKMLLIERERRGY